MMEVQKIPPQGAEGASARIVLDIDAAGRVLMHAECFGRCDSGYAYMTDRRLLGFAVPHALAELRLLLKLDRYLTIEESAVLAADIRAQAQVTSSGSATTV
jgi:hypothetical protein